VLLQTPESLDTIHALLLLAVFAPFGVLPSYPTNPADIAVAYGYLTTALSVSLAVNLPSIEPLAMICEWSLARNSTEVWTWMSLSTLEATMALEHEPILHPSNLTSTCRLAEHLIRGANQHLAEIGQDGMNSSEMGKMLVAERIVRLAIIHEELAVMSQILETCSLTALHSPPEQMAECLQRCLRRLELSIYQSDSLTGESD
jgi:hypothetical protein